MWTLSQVVDVGCDVGACRRLRADMMGTAKSKIILKGTAISINRCTGEAKIALDCQPGAGTGQGHDLRITLPADGGHMPSLLLTVRAFFLGFRKFQGIESNALM